MPRDEKPIRPLNVWRKRLAKSQTELADEIGVKLSTLRTWEQCTSHPRPAAHRKLSEYFHVEPWQITFDKSDLSDLNGTTDDPSEPVAPAA